MHTSKYTLLFLLFVLFQNLSAQWEILWHKDLSDMSFGNAAMADLDGDGMLEIAFSMYRNDERIVVVNAEDGSVLWEQNTGGCNDAAPLIFDVDMDGELELILASSCNPTTFCFNGASGEIEWSTQTHGSDSPPSAADMDNDGKPEILYGCFGGWLTCLNGEDGSIVYDILVDPDSWIQTSPAILDIGNNGQLDFVIANWSFIEDHRIFAFNGKDGSLLWETDLPEAVMYHGASVGDLDKDGNPELVIGDYSGKLMVLNAEDGSLAFDYRATNSYSVSAPTNLADLDGDGFLEIVLFDWFQLIVLDHTGNLLWKYDIPGYPSVFRGAAISDVNGDNSLDLIFGSSDGFMHAVEGKSGEAIYSYNLQEHFGENSFDIQHGPVVGDFDQDGMIDFFIAGGHAEYPEIENNYGRIYALTTNQMGGPDWSMFRRDARRNACICDTLTDLDQARVEPLALDYKYDAWNKELIFSSTKENMQGQFYIYDVNGNLILSKNQFINTSIPVGELPDGFYFVKCIYEGGENLGRFVKY